MPARVFTGVVLVGGCGMVAPLLSLLPLLLAASPTPTGMPAVGTFFEPWYTARGTYKWSFPTSSEHGGDDTAGTGAAPGVQVQGDGCPASSPLLFGDVTGDGRDDLIQTRCGTAGDGWRVSFSNGVSSWGNVSKLWWRDGHSSSPSSEMTERLVADLNGDGAADAAVWTLADGWTPVCRIGILALARMCCV